MAGSNSVQDEGLLRVIGTKAVALAVGGLILQIPMDEAMTIGALIGTCIVIYVIRAVLRKRENQ